MNRFLILMLLVLGHFGSVDAQPGQSNTELANQYAGTGECDKAVVYFEKAYDQDLSVYQGYLTCLIKIKDYERAEKLIRKHQKRIPQDPSIKVDLGDVYTDQGQAEKARKLYLELIKDLKPDINQVNLLANAFTKRQMFDYSIQTYIQGRNVLKGTYSFSFELADAYGRVGNFLEMVNEYITLLETNPGYMANVQTILQNKIANDLTGGLNDLIRQALLRKIQKQPDVVHYSELLYWLFLQEKDFESAFLQAKGLDRRLGEEGERLLELGRTSLSNGDFTTAENCFMYVINLGKEAPNYLTGRMELINATNERITGSGKYTQEDLLRLESDYESALAELGRSQATAPLLRSYAHLKAFFLFKTDEAIAILDETLELPNLRPPFKSECKLELADIYVFDGQVWDAALLYGQVDKDFKNDALGREAKYRNARLSYFMGEFDWAKDQLNVLKAATSQLISNDALSLALLITDNTNLDTTTEALLMYARADLLDFQNKDSLSILTLDSLLAQFPGHTLTDDVLYKQATIRRSQGRDTEAAALYQQVVDKYGQDILADDALFQLADLVQNRLEDKDRAMKLFEELLTKYPGSLFTVDARKRFRQLRGDKLN